METSLSLATDSFSRSWLSNCKPPEDGLEGSLRASIHSLMAAPQNLNFDFSITQSPSAVLAHADELFSDGFIRPVVFLDLFKGHSCSNNTPDSTQAIPSSFFYSGIVSPTTVEIHHPGFLRRRPSARGSPQVGSGEGQMYTAALPQLPVEAERLFPGFEPVSDGLRRKWRKSTQHNLRSIFRYLKKFCKRLGCSRKSTRVSDFEKTKWEVKSWSSISQQAMGDLCGNENSIYEAVLHCKRSIGK